MSHEQAPKDREQQLRANELLIAAHVPVFADIALANHKPEQLSALLHTPSLSAEAVVIANNSFYDVTFTRLYAGTPDMRDVIVIEELAPTLEGDTKSKEHIYKFETGKNSSARFITERRAIKDKYDSIERFEGSIDDPVASREFFERFVELSPDGTVVPKYALVEPKKAEKLLKRHRGFIDREFGRERGRRSYATRARAIGTKALDDFGKNSNGFGLWH